MSSPRRLRCRTRAEGGQAAVELVALLPLVALVLALAWQAVLAGHAAWAAAAAARAAARAEAVGASADAAARAHLPGRLERELRLSRPQAGTVVVSVRIPEVLGAVALGRARGTGRFRPQEGA